VECNNYMKLLMQRKILSLRVWKVWKQFHLHCSCVYSLPVLFASCVSELAVCMVHCNDFDIKTIVWDLDWCSQWWFIETDVRLV
jgi:hypothetical protein